MNSLAYTYSTPLLDYCNPDEFEQLVDLAFDYHRTAPDFFTSINPSKMITRLATAMSKHPVFVVRDNDNLIVGAIVLDTGIPWWGDEKYLTDLFIYIKEDHRSFKNIKQLCDRVKEYSDNMSMDLQMVLYNPDDLDRKRVLFDRLGFNTTAFTVGYTGE